MFFAVEDFIFQLLGALNELRMETCCRHSLWATEMLKQWYFYHQSAFLL